MNAIDKLLELAVKHGCDNLSPNCEVCKEMQQLMKEVRKALKLQEIFEQDLIDWKSSSEMKPECGYAAMNQPFIDRVYSVLKSIKEKSEK